MIPLFDLHCDTLSVAYERGYSLYSSPLNISFDKCKSLSPYTQIMAIWTNDILNDNDGFSQYLKIIEYAKNQNIVFSVRHDDAEDFSLLLAIEDLRLIEKDQSRLLRFYDDGVRFITPVWKGKTQIGGAWDTSEGLSPFGKRALSLALDLGITLDLSHSSVKSFYDILELCHAKGRIPVATHSNSFSICPHKRNLSSTQFREIIKVGGIVGISLCPDHLTTAKVATINDILRHIDHYLSLGGENNIALGCDFDGVSALPLEIHNISNLTLLYERLLKLYNENIANKIFRRNSCDLMKRIFL
ncbi:MAG: membrane dipeptidase [Clostridia bacterium]|nr:membrane dipeptidase [Clostridia bacterium]